MSDFTKEKIIKAIIKGASYLLKSINEDGGVKYENERSDISGIWVTAEVLESLLTSKVLPLSVYSKIEPMIDFLLNTQHVDGSWCVLARDYNAHSSSISTGHCTYALKLALVGGYLNDNRIKVAIEKGEHWLRSRLCCVEKNGYVFWTSEPISKKKRYSIDPNHSIKSRMEFIFSSFYAIMGFVNPHGYRVEKDVDAGIINKARLFFEEQAEFFIGQYRSEDSQTMDIVSLAKTASTICRLINVFNLLELEVSDSIKNGLRDVLMICSKSPFLATSIVMHSQSIDEYTAVYNNNTPFDMANSFLGLGANSESLRIIISGYLDHQDQEGFWYLNFSRECSVNTWTTAEALIVLNKAIEQFAEIELSDKKALIDKQNTELHEKIKEMNKIISSLRLKSLLSAFISIILAIILIIFLIIWSSFPQIKDTFIEKVFDILIIPLIIWIVGVIWGIISSLVKPKM